MTVSLVFSVLLTLLAGSCAYLFFLNRYLIEIKDRGRKFPIIATSMAAVLLGSPLFGYFAAGSSWMIVPGLVLAATLLGEVRRAVIRRRLVQQLGKRPGARTQQAIVVAACNHPAVCLQSSRFPARIN